MYTFITCQSLFPGIKSFIPVNLDVLTAVAKNLTPSSCANLHKDPQATQHLIRSFERNTGTSYGGWAETRQNLWAGSYMDATGNYTHLGVDINVVKDTPVVLPFTVEVVDAITDTDTDVGWGTRLILKTANPTNPYIVLGHLTSSSLKPVGTVIPSGETVGIVSTYPDNGNVFEHLHIQLVKPEYLETKTWAELDGYGSPAEIDLYPDPLNTPFL